MTTKRSLLLNSNEYYDDDDVVYFYNQEQSIAYLNAGAKLVDLFINEKNKLTFVFSKADHKRLKEKWMKHEIR